jgi:hypothetical protein
MHDQGSTSDTPVGKGPIKTQIDENLKRVYQSALVQEVPDRFKLLLQQLKDKEAGK